MVNPSKFRPGLPSQGNSTFEGGFGSSNAPLLNNPIFKHLKGDIHKDYVGENVLSTVEYTVIKKKMVNQLAALGDRVKGLILYGSIAKGDGFYIPGESDIDFYLVVDGGDILETYEKINRIIEGFRTEPLFAPLLDLRVVEEEDIRPQPYNAHGTILALGASKGEVLLGENVLQDVEFPGTVIKEVTKALIVNSYVSYTNILTGGYGLDPYGIALEGSEHVLACAHAYLAYEGETERVRYELPEIFQQRYGNSTNFDADTVLEAHRYRLGIQKIDPEEFIRQAFKFCKAIKKQISHE